MQWNNIANVGGASSFSKCKKIFRRIPSSLLWVVSCFFNQKIQLFSNTSKSSRSFPAKTLSPLLPVQLACLDRLLTPARLEALVTLVAFQAAFLTGYRKTSSSESQQFTTTLPTKKMSWPSVKDQQFTSWRKMTTAGGKGSWTARPVFFREIMSKLLFENCELLILYNILSRLFTRKLL